MVTPLPLKLTMSTDQPSLKAPKSPVKKHLHAAHALQTADQAPVQSTSRVSLRTSSLQLLLGVVDRDDAALEVMMPIFQVLASLPLDRPAVRRECLAMLKDLEVKHSKTPKPTGPKPRSPAHSPRDSGRAKSPSLSHCKAFLLACANEIHDLEDENPVFDYAETCSETAGSCSTIVKPSAMVHDRTALLSTKQTNTKKLVHRIETHRDDEFDYASTADGSSSVPTDIALALEQDAEMSDPPKTRETKEAIQSNGTMRRRFQFSQTKQTQHKTTQTAQLALKYKAFHALKQHQHQSTRSLNRKRQAFQKIEAWANRHHATSTPMQTPAVLPTSVSLSNSTRVWIVQHLELIVVLVLLWAAQV